MLRIDSKAIPALERCVFLEMVAGGLSAACIVCSIWESEREALRETSRLRDFISRNSDILYLVRGVADIEAKTDDRKVGIVIAWQNATGFGEHLPLVDLYADMGLRVVQVAFLTANAAGSGCYESVDTGLTDYGRELVLKLNDAGIAIDIAHLGAKTASDVVTISREPVFYSQSSPRVLKEHQRNKTDAEMRSVANKGGIVSLAALPHYLPSGIDSTVDDMAVAIKYVVNVVGEESVAIGSDLTAGQPKAFYDYVSHDKGFGRQLIDYSTLPVLEGMASFKDYENVERAMSKLGLSSGQIEKIMGKNLIRYFGEVWAR